MAIWLLKSLPEKEFRGIETLRLISLEARYRQSPEEILLEQEIEFTGRLKELRNISEGYLRPVRVGG